jgi:hypothetical protein
MSLAILAVTRFVEAVGELGNLFVCTQRLTAGVLSHTSGAQVSSPEIANTNSVRGDYESCACHDF